MTTADLTSLFGEPISVYTRAQALADSVLVDLSAWAGSGPDGMLGGFKVPVAVTAAVWGDIHAIPARLEGLASVRGRAHDLLWMASCAARRAGDGPEVRFRLILPIQGERRQERTYKLHIGPGDQGEPVVTILRPDED